MFDDTEASEGREGLKQNFESLCWRTAIWTAFRGIGYDSRHLWQGIRILLLLNVVRSLAEWEVGNQNEAIACDITER